MNFKNVEIEWGECNSQMILYPMSPQFKVVEIITGGDGFKDDAVTTFFDTEEKALSFIKSQQDKCQAYINEGEAEARKEYCPGCGLELDDDGNPLDKNAETCTGCGGA